MASVYQILVLLLDVLWFFVIAHVIMSWLISFDVLNVRQPLVQQAWSGLNAILRPIYAPIRSLIRRLVPSTGAIDFTPLVVILVLASLRIILHNNAAAFY
jgi:YggT family protein